MDRVTIDVTTHVASQVIDGEWATFPGGELEGKRPKALCPACRAQLQQQADGDVARQNGAPMRRAVCFQCYRADIERERALKAAGELNTASAERFQTALPFEPVNRPRLEMLKAERASARLAVHHGVAQFEDRRRDAQRAARHALEHVVAGLAARKATPTDRAREIAYVIHAAELQLPESWLPFVVSR